VTEDVKRKTIRRLAARPELRPVVRSAIDLLIRFHIVYKNARIFEPNNATFEETLPKLREILEAIYGEESEAAFQLRQNSLFFNGTRLKFGFQNYPIFKFLVAELKRMEIGGLVFHPGVTEDELRRFIFLLAKREARGARTFAEVSAEMRADGFERIEIERIPQSEITTSQEKFAAKVYFLSILHLKDSFDRDSHNEKIRVATSRRLVQSIYNHIVDNESFVYGLTNLKNHDDYTLNHSVNVCALAVGLGRRIGLQRTELMDLGISAFFHDLGKLDTPKEILEKPGALDDEERAIMQKHPHQGAEKLLHLREFRNLPLRAIHVALEHHIREDRTGYPPSFRKREANLFSKIVKIADYFDAITTKRAYRAKVFTRAEALDQMLGCSGTEFHPLLLKVFASMLGRYPIGSFVLLDSGEMAVVVDINPEPQFQLRPRVKLATDVEGNKIDGEETDLTEIDPATGRFRRTIVRVLEPTKYGVNVADYFLAKALGQG
jgi:HD-GYP domain-containing protein (c-di-GMP phosphodiesterase class II)